MQPADRTTFADLLNATLAVYNAQINPAAIEIWWRSLIRFDIAVIRAALQSHICDPAVGKFAPKPADVIAQIIATDGRQTADEAWADCPQSEAETAVWTTETYQAYFMGAHEILKDGDRIAARMAFKGAYERVVAGARNQGLPIRWLASLGHDKHHRESKLIAAAESGRLELSYVRAVLPHLEQPQLERLDIIDQMAKKMVLPSGDIVGK